MSSAVRRAATTSRQHVRSKVTGTPSFHPAQLLRVIYQPIPKPINCTTLPTTTIYAEDQAHPFHVRTQRRLEQFDHERLHYRVQCPLDVSKKSFLRSWAAKRVRRAIEKELQSLQEIHESGQLSSEAPGIVLKKPQQVHSHEEHSRLKGALFVILSKTKISLTATDEQVRESAAWLIKYARSRQTEARKKRGIEEPKDEGILNQREIKSASKCVNEAAVHAPERYQDPEKQAQDIRSQVEYYFSDSNLPQDRHMLHLISGLENKAVSLKKIMKFRRMKKIKDVEVVKEALGRSAELEIVESESGMDVGVSRRVALDEALLAATLLEMRRKGTSVGEMAEFASIGVEQVERLLAASPGKRMDGGVDEAAGKILE